MNICKKLFGWMRKEKSFVRFYSVEPGVAELYPIMPSAEYKRQWMQTAQPEDPDNGPMYTKNCPGIKKVINSGWIMRAPADFIIRTSGNGVTFEWLEAKRFTKVTPGWSMYIGSHNQHQTEIILDNPNTTLKTAVKVDSPWRLKTSSDMLLMQIPISYNNESRFTAATGIIDPRYTPILNVQMFWHVLDGETLVRAGTPLCQYIPIKREDLNLRAYDVTIDTATDEDRASEERFNYATSCVFLKHDNIGARLKRVIKAIN